MMDKAVVVGIDGTWKKSSDRTCVKGILKAAEERGATTIYQRGVGNRPLTWLWDGMTGRGIGKQIRRVYRKTGEHLGRDDRLYVFGYSRGGAAAISLTNLLLRCGVSGAVRERAVAREAWRAYGARAGYAGMRQAEFAEKYEAWRPKVQLLGLFDPVGALGVPFPRQLARIGFGQHDLTLRAGVHAYIALLAVDEHRRALRPVVQIGDYPEQIVRQVWCPGNHADVGGKTRLAKAALALMGAEAKKAGLALGSLPDVPADLDMEDITKAPRILSRIEVSQRDSSWNAGQNASPLVRDWGEHGGHPDTLSWRRAIQLPALPLVDVASMGAKHADRELRCTS